jgi:crossover junction endodeoxyribonuclease RuvC
MILSIDPGNTGAIAELTRDGALHAIHDIPVVDGYVNAALLDELVGNDIARIERVVLEQARSMPKQGVASTFKYGVGYGVILGVCARYPIDIILPREWKGEMRLAGKDKDAARQRAIGEWPRQADWFARKKDHNRAEAALLGLWWLNR